MLDRRLIREQPDLVRKALQDRGSDFDLDALIALEARRRELLSVEGLKAGKNDLSRQIGAAVQAGGSADELKAQVAELSAKIESMEAELVEVEADFDRKMLEIPNVPKPEVPVLSLIHISEPTRPY